MKKYMILLLIILLSGCRAPIEEVAAETTSEPYTINIDTVTQGEITYKKLVIHNHEEYEDVMERSKKLLEEVSVDLREFGEVSIIFYRDKRIYCVVDGTSMEVYYLK
jgi:hypothetical protein